MCRLLVYKGVDAIQLSHLVTRPAHSIINQAFDARLRLDATRSVNGDGFGVGWYDARADAELGNAPCIFTSVTPAWNNQNLQRLAEKIKSPLVFAHVRASTAGALSETNCHPWRYGRLMWMHNGQISGFPRIKRRLLAALPEELFLYPQGHTDSEFAFAVFLSHLKDPSSQAPLDYREMQSAMLATIQDFNGWAKQAGVEEPSLMNFCVTDGESVVCTRYVSSRTDEAASLYFSSGTSFYEHAPGAYRMVKADKREKIVVVASEPLTFEKADWMEIATNTLVCVTPRMNVLQYPIRDEFYVEHADSQMRSPAFALKTGFAPNVPLSAAPGAAPRDADAAALPIPGRETAVVAPVPARRFIPPATPLTPSLASVYAQMQGAAPARRGAAA
ncbi:N-terminal nucleophile aminohydrolase [Tilletiopsis washingtonensis]|uniref:N-terminal nucleophile aminohydrolase n=1 Tax=Tilletiopsis washingtonensis TaxID=58919 RepID=A0A316Z0E4_9BASI|nr:N-terminal nucleophile aminohydrolase [Tilletiopsis washingtonensis]PWN94484.1 N-terminal nucleophile aminohydrolase [Tilletiopsis washingtonensis]